ncbi:MAG TPA: polymer-forming cytoskeletal protein [Bryobacteraceae bacterium]|nr:polymer-forming cytoskeletal protein [Bryobacteraceae bacterium]
MPQPKPSSTVLGKSVTIVGEIVSQEDLTIDGDVKGSVEARDSRLTIGPNGKLEASSLKAREVVVMGTVRGNVEALNKVFIRKDATLVGDVQTAGIVIEDGAYFKGGIDIQTRK